MGAKGPELENRVDEVFLRMFIGAGLNSEWTHDLVHEFAVWAKDKKKRKKVPKHFLNSNISGSLREKII
ncbi:hypothetical protein KY339_05630 [Candidatus Woesearchaeota archaeon]|nr:hypothetical protein [Candidatus Woesearchaeota archaeon]